MYHNYRIILLTTTHSLDANTSSSINGTVSSPSPSTTLSSKHESTSGPMASSILFLILHTKS